MDVGEATRLYQAVQHEAAANPEDELLERELEQARKEMEVAWLKHSTKIT